MAVDYAKEIQELIEVLIAEGGSDLHLAVGAHPTIRATGSLVPLLKKPMLSPEDARGFTAALLNEVQMGQFLRTKEVDFSYAYRDGIRFRGNGFFQRSEISIALRLIPNTIKTIAELHLPPILESFAARPQGFFLCVGPVGQGKSTTLAAMIELINTTRSEHIVTIEDPIEFVFRPKKALIEQREVRVDTADFHTALNSVFRQDVDVIMVGEMRNPETISMAVTAAETGHLVLSTLHTNNAAQTVDRIIDSFPAGQQDQIRIQLAGSLLGIFSQRLVRRTAGGLVPVYELLLNTPAVSNLIRERRTHEIQTVIETGAEYGMIEMNRSLADMVHKGEIAVEEAFLHSINPRGLERLL